jgi:hypothetical protein
MTDVPVVDAPQVQEVEEASAGAIALGAHLFEQEYLYAFATQPEVSNYIRTQAAQEDRNRLPEIISRWAAIQSQVQATVASEAGLPDTIEITAIPDALLPTIQAYVADPMFARQFQLPTTIAFVEIDKLVAYQRMVNLKYIARLSQQIGENPAPEDLARVCVSPQRDMDPIQHLEQGGAHSFSSPNSDIRFLGSFLKGDLAPEDIVFAQAGGVPAAAIIAFVGYGTPMINALHVGSRVILNNGFHRVVALRRLGVERIPVVLQQIGNAQLELASELGGLNRDYLVTHPRPALVKDFFHEGYTITLRIRERLRLINLGIQVGQQEVPV